MNMSARWRGLLCGGVTAVALVLDGAWRLRIFRAGFSVRGVRAGLRHHALRGRIRSRAHASQRPRRRAVDDPARAAHRRVRRHQLVARRRRARARHRHCDGACACRRCRRWRPLPICAGRAARAPRRCTSSAMAGRCCSPSASPRSGKASTGCCSPIISAPRRSAPMASSPTCCGRVSWCLARRSRCRW